MALVLRKAVMPKNVSLLKCLRGRPMATSANKKNPAPLSKAAASRSLKDEIRTIPSEYTKVQKSKQLKPIDSCQESRRANIVRYCVSCPNIVPETRTKLVPLRQSSLSSTTAVCLLPYTRNISNAVFSLSNRLLQSNLPTCIAKRGYGTPCSCGCPCPMPCGPYGCPSGCNCLPPPCNQAPKCIQYMTGYYYYPYGVWFCGPYHVTGTCKAVSPPCPACGPCPCCAPCCVCSAVSGTTPAKKEMPRSGIVPNPQVQVAGCELEDKVKGSGISRLFPFNSTMAPGSQTGFQRPANQTDFRKTSPKFSSFHCPYSSLASQDFKSQTNELLCNRPGKAWYSQPRSTRQFCDSCIPPLTQLKPNDCFTQEKFFLSNNINRKVSRSPIRHKRTKKVFCDMSHQGSISVKRDCYDDAKVNGQGLRYFSIPEFKTPSPSWWKNAKRNARWMNKPSAIYTPKNPLHQGSPP